MRILSPSRGLPHRRSDRRWPVAGVLGGLLLSLALAVPALAHAELVSSDPADNATVAPPATITLTFSQALDPAKSSFKLLGPDGATIGTGTATSDTAMTLGGLALGAGTYQVKWTSASADDGDIARGELSFNVTAATPSPASQPTAAPSDGAGGVPTAEPASAPAAAATPTPGAAPTGPAATSNSDVLVPLVAALVVVVVGGAFVVRRSRGA